MSKTDHLGLDARARVMVQIERRQVGAAELGVRHGALRRSGAIALSVLRQLAGGGEGGGAGAGYG